MTQLEQMYKEHRGLVYAIAYSKLRDPHQAEAITSQVFTYLHLSIHAGKFIASNPPGWLSTVTNRVVASYKRQLLHQANRSAKTQRLGNYEVETDSGFVQNERNEELQHSINQLSPFYQNLLRKCFFEDDSPDNIAAAIGCAPGSFWYHKRQALAALKEVIEERGILNG